MNPLHDIAAHLVATDTVSSRGNAALMGELGDRLDRGRLPQCASSAGGREPSAKANLVAVAGPPEPDGLVLSGHLDVVPFADQPGWTRDPLRLAFDGDRVYGRGTSRHEGVPRAVRGGGAPARPRGPAPARRLPLHRGRGDRLPRRRAARAGARRAARRRAAAGARVDRRAHLVARAARAQGRRRLRRDRARPRRPQQRADRGRQRDRGGGAGAGRGRRAPGRAAPPAAPGVRTAVPRRALHDAQLRHGAGRDGDERDRRAVHVHAELPAAARRRPELGAA